MTVIPAKAGIQTKITLFVFYNVIIDWIPSYEGMTNNNDEYYNCHYSGTS